MIFLKSLLVFVIIVNTYAICDGKSEKNSKERLPFFRRTVEETNNEVTLETSTEDPQSQLVSFLVKNVKEIFSDVYNEEGSKEIEKSTVYQSTLLFRPTKTSIDSYDSSTGKSVYYSSIDNLHFDRALYFTRNITSTNIALDSTIRVNTKMTTETSEKKELLKLSKYTSIIENNEVKEIKQILNLENDKKMSSFNDTDVLENKVMPVSSIPKRVCIFCNNVNLADCMDPKDKLMPSTVCENDGDLCYSQHTPFGIIDRGCFNVKKNLTTYVCSCNLCNHLSISEMPHIFNEHDDWITDIIELSKTQGFRRSVFKYMSCLKCEVNTTSKIDMLNDANCLEGNIGSVPTEDCDQDEVCAVQSIPGIGYIKRGCVKTPLYNYWLTLCDSDLCNYEPLASVY